MAGEREEGQGKNALRLKQFRDRDGLWHPFRTLPLCAWRGFPPSEETKPLRIPTRRFPAGVDRRFDDFAADVSQITRMVALGHVFRAESADVRDVFESPCGAVKVSRPTGA